MPMSVSNFLDICNYSIRDYLKNWLMRYNAGHEYR